MAGCNINANGSNVGNSGNSVNTIGDTDTTGTPEDPVFAGLTTATKLDATSIQLVWSIATDNKTPSSNIVYEICVSASLTGCATFIAVYTTPAGALTFNATSLAPDTTYYFVARARDESGNTSKTMVQLSAKTDPISALDTTPPTFGGAVTASNTTATSLTLNWTAATDTVTPSASIIYEICQSTSPTGCNAFSATYTTTAGAVSYPVTGLTSSTTYYFKVRAVDQAANRTVNTNLVTISTLDTTPPTFSGLSSIYPSGSTATLSWTAASDNVTAAPNMVYLVCQSQTINQCQNSFVTTYTTSAGATGLIASSLISGGVYYFVVRTNDQAGNVDTNTIEISVTMDDTAPPVFGGLNAILTPDVSTTQVTLRWTTAADDVSNPGNIVYDICQSTISSVCASSFVASYTSNPGATSYAVSGLTSAVTYYFVVRAKDETGNRDVNTTERAVTTVDGIAPTAPGTPTFSSITGTSMTVSWTAGTDNVTPTGNLIYELCKSTSPTGCSTFNTTYSTAAGVTSQAVTGLTSSTTYYFTVRTKYSGRGFLTVSFVS